MSLTQSTMVKGEVNTMSRVLTNSLPNRNWYVLYTAPRAEKIAKRELEQKGYEVFLPITRTLKVWKNRQKKMVDTILFPSYVFINTYEKYLAEICRINKIKTFLHCGGKASKIDLQCIEGIKQMLNLDRKISVCHDFIEGEQVRITKGPLAGYEGILISQKSKTKFGIHLKEINQTVLIEVSTDIIEKKVH